MGVVWLASYPKSGNTWLRFLVYSYLYGPPDSSADVGERIPDIHHGTALEVPAGGRLPVKTHLRPGPHHPLMNRTDGFVYVVRHPKDVLLSNLNYARLANPQAFDDRAYVEHFIRHMGIQSWISGGIGSWPGNVAGWLAALSDWPGAILRYEDLKADPHAQMRKVVPLIDDGPVDEARIARAVQASSIDRMRGMEDRERASGQDSRVFVINKDNRGAEQRFVGKGGSGQTLAHLGEDLDHMFDARFSQVLTMLGYDRPERRPPGHRAEGSAEASSSRTSGPSSTGA